MRFVRDTPAGERDRWRVAGDAALVVIVMVPFVVALIRAVRSEWYPIGDNAYFSVRPRDVFTEHHPWLGTWTSASRSAGTTFNNPGPVQWDLLAATTKPWPIIGPAVATALINATCAAATVVIGLRLAGRIGGLACASAVAWLTWSMGSSLVVEPWQPHALLIPFLLFGVACWATACGRAWGPVVVVAVGSLLVQAHVSYALLVPMTLVVAIVVARWPGPVDGLGGRDHLRWGIAAVIVGLVLWAQPIGEQLAGGDDGNMARLFESAQSSDEPTVGSLDAARLLTGVVLPDHVPDRASFVDTLVPSEPVRADDPGVPSAQHLPSGLGAALRSAVLMGALVGALALARRRSDTVGVAAVVVVATLLLLGWVTLTLLPLGAYQGLAAHQIRWLWPSLGLAAALLLVAVVGRRPGAPLVIGIWGAAVALLVVSASTEHRQPTGPTVDDYAMPVMRELGPQLAAADVPPRVLLDHRALRTFEPFSIAVLLELERAGTTVAVDDPPLIRQLGDARAADGSETARLLVLQGESPAVPEGSRVIAAQPGLDSAADAERRRLAGGVADALARGDLVLTRAGKEAAAAGQLPAQVAADGDEVLASRGPRLPALLAVEVQAGHVAARGEGARALERWADLEVTWDQGSVTVALAPLASGSASGGLGQDRRVSAGAPTR